jgi:hypothetical protein
MKEVTSPAWPKWSFPIPVDVQTGTGGDKKKNENEEQALHDKKWQVRRKSRKEEVERRKLGAQLQAGMQVRRKK